MKPTATELIERIEQAISSYRYSREEEGLFEELRAHLSDPWISVEERLPEDYEPVSFHDGDSVFSGYRSRLHGSWYRPETESYIGNVTHLCPLPPLPQKAGEE